MGDAQMLRRNMYNIGIIIIIIIDLFSFDQINVNYNETIYIACSATLHVMLQEFVRIFHYLVERGITVRHDSLSTMVVGYPTTLFSIPNMVTFPFSIKETFITIKFNNKQPEYKYEIATFPTQLRHKKNFFKLVYSRLFRAGVFKQSCRKHELISNTVKVT